MPSYIVDLSEEKKRIAEEAKKAAIQIVKDAIDKRCYGFPVSFRYSCAEPVDSHTFCCIPTKEFLQLLLAKLNEISFKEDSKEDDTYAYVEPPDSKNIVYLCKQFWNADTTLCRDSQPGTLIHEVSHLLGTEDITYEHLTVELYEKHGTLLGKSQSCEDEDGGIHYREEVVQVNANSLEYEFETIINHQDQYCNEKYPCCGETKKNSVCKHRSRGHYYLHETFVDLKEDMELKVAKFMEEIKTRATTEGQRKRYVKKQNEACEVIPLSEP